MEGSTEKFPFGETVIYSLGYDVLEGFCVECYYSALEEAFRQKGFECTEVKFFFFLVFSAFVTVYFFIEVT